MLTECPQPSFLAAKPARKLASGFARRGSKNRVVGFARHRRQSRRGLRPQRPQTATSYEGCIYETASGRRFWPSTDPIRFEGGNNLYAYVNNAPTNYNDPMGLETEPFHADISYFGITTGAVDGSYVWSCAAGHESAMVDLTPGLTGTVSLGVTLWNGSVAVGVVDSVETSNRSRYESCGGSCVKYIVDLSVTIKKTGGIVISYTSVMDQGNFYKECPCRKNTSL